MTRIELTKAIDEIAKGEMPKGIPEDITRPNIGMNTKIGYATILGKYALGQEYLALEFLELHEGLQFFALERLLSESTNGSEALYLTEKGFPYQILLQNLLIKGLSKANYSEINQFLSLYLRNAKVANDLKLSNSHSDVELRQRLFLENRLSLFEEAYLKKTGKSKNDAYYSRFEGLIEYISQHEKLIQESGAGKQFENLLSSAVDCVLNELITKEHGKPIEEVREIVYNGLKRLKGTFAYSILEDMSRRIPEYKMYKKNEESTFKKFMKTVLA